MSCVRYETLIPKFWELMLLAYFMLSGDPLRTYGIPRHGKRSLSRDKADHSKLDTYRAAFGNDTDFFEQIANAKKLTPSDIVEIPKETPGEFRKIASLAEDKRLHSAYIFVKYSSYIETFLTPRQRARGNPALLELNPTGWKADASLAAVLFARSQQYPWAVSTDLTKAYDRVSKRSVINALTSIKFSRKAAQRVWEVIRCPKGRGIEQGNPLSSLILNLIVSPVLNAIEASLDAFSYSYLDDFYFMAKNESDAHRAFEMFESQINAVGFLSNKKKPTVRPIGKGQKDTRIINLEAEPITILRSFEITQSNIRFSEGKDTKKFLPAYQKQIKKVRLVQPGLRSFFKEKGSTHARSTLSHQESNITLHGSGKGHLRAMSMPPPSNPTSTLEDHDQTLDEALDRMDQAFSPIVYSSTYSSQSTEEELPMALPILTNVPTRLTGSIEHLEEVVELPNILSLIEASGGDINLSNPRSSRKKKKSSYRDEEFAPVSPNGPTCSGSGHSPLLNNFLPEKDLPPLCSIPENFIDRATSHQLNRCLRLHSHLGKAVISVPIQSVSALARLAGCPGLSYNVLGREDMLAYLERCGLGEDVVSKEFLNGRQLFVFKRKTKNLPAKFQSWSDITILDASLSHDQIEIRYETNKNRSIRRFESIQPNPQISITDAVSRIVKSKANKRLRVAIPVHLIADLSLTKTGARNNPRNVGLLLAKRNLQQTHLWRKKDEFWLGEPKIKPRRKTPAAKKVPKGNDRLGIMATALSKCLITEGKSIGV
jgi:hypothetical protein